MQEYSIDNKNTKIQSTMRSLHGKAFIFAVNLDDQKDYTITFSGKFKGFMQLDLESLEVKEVSTTLHFEPNQSYVLFLQDKKVEREPKKREMFLNAPFKIVEMSDNYFTLDKLQYSFDGISYSDKLGYMGIFNQLIDLCYKGKVYLKYTFYIENIPSRIAFLAETNKSYCLVNGKIACFNGCSDFEKQLFKADVTDFVKVGLNEIIIETDFYQNNDVYEVLLGENITEGLKNKLEYTTSIEACYLQGDFGVYSRQGFVEGLCKDVLLSDNFYIAERKSIISDTVQDGYPFFAGNMTFEKTFIWQGGGCVLNLKGKYCLARLIINNVPVKKSYFSNKVDISNYLVKGNNTIIITVWSGNRNLFGPHHLLNNEDPKAVGPYSFELKGTWKDGKSSAERENYSFVKFGI